MIASLSLTDWIRRHGHLCQGIGTEAPHPARELTVVGADDRPPSGPRVLCTSCAQAWHRAISGRPRR